MGAGAWVNVPGDLALIGRAHAESTTRGVSLNITRPGCQANYVPTRQPGGA